MSPQWLPTRPSPSWALWPQTRGWMPPRSCLDLPRRDARKPLASLLHKYAHTFDRNPTQSIPVHVFLPFPWTGRNPHGRAALRLCCSSAAASVEDLQKSVEEDDQPSGSLSLLCRSWSSLPACITFILFKFDFSVLFPSMTVLSPLHALCKKPECSGHLLEDNCSVLHSVLQDHTVNWTQHEGQPV